MAHWKLRLNMALRTGFRQASCGTWPRSRRTALNRRAGMPSHTALLKSAQLGYSQRRAGSCCAYHCTVVSRRATRKDLPRILWPQHCSRYPVVKLGRKACRHDVLHTDTWKSTSGAQQWKMFFSTAQRAHVNIWFSRQGHTGMLRQASMHSPAQGTKC